MTTRNHCGNFCIALVCLAGISGCYNNWPQLTEVANEISCEMTATEIEALAVKYKADVEWDKTSHSLSIAKQDDAIAIVFDEENKKIKVIAKTHSDISFGGLIRRKGNVDVVKRCL